jgi:hypothetical protein
LLTPGWTKITQRHPKRCAPQATLRPWLPSVAQVTVISRVASLCLPSASSAAVAEGATFRRASSAASTRITA